MRLKKEDRKAQILEKAKELFVEKGYHHTKTRDIAKACDISEPVIYKHFSSKEQLFITVIGQIAGETFDNIDFNGKEDTKHILQSFVLNRVDVVESNFPIFKRLLCELLENELIRNHYFEEFFPSLARPIIGYIDQLKDKNQIRREVPSIVITLALAGIFLMISLAKNLSNDSPFEQIPSKELAEQMLQIYLYGLLNEPIT